MKNHKKFLRKHNKKLGVFELSWKNTLNRFQKCLNAPLNRCFSSNEIHPKGFTLIELMVVVVILGILASLIVPRLMGRTDEAKIVKAKVDIAAIETGLKLYRLDNGIYPTTEQGLLALIEEPNTEPLPRKWHKGGYIEKGQIPKDPWDREYIYLSPGVHNEYDIISYGADGSPGGEDKDSDIKSWELE